MRKPATSCSPVLHVLFFYLLWMPPVARAADFAKGGDVGWLAQMEASGYVFKDRDGRPADCLRILKGHGMDTIRLRVFVNPSQDPRSGHCSGEEVAAMAARATRMGFRILLDFHYSDSWADPKQQKKPVAWAKHTVAELQADVYEHTRAVLATVKALGATPEWVQVGNEIRDGMLWPDGKLADGKNLSGLINAGFRAVKESDARTKVIVHLDSGHNNGLFRHFFDTLQRNGARYDVIGMSYYPYWQRVEFTKSMEDLGRNLNDMVTRYGKEVMVVEVGGEDSKVENTRAMLEAVLKTVRAVPEHKGLGVIYWEPEGAASWSHYKLSCWGDDGRPTAALDAFLEGKPLGR